MKWLMRRETPSIECNMHRGKVSIRRLTTEVIMAKGQNSTRERKWEDRDQGSQTSPSHHRQKHGVGTDRSKQGTRAVAFDKNSTLLSFGVSTLM